MQSATCDTFGRPNNYPSIWPRSFSWLHLGVEDTDLVGFVLLVAFALGCFALLWTMHAHRTSTLALIASSLSVVSPPSLLAIERGNVDLLVFSLLGLAIVLQARGHELASVPFLALGTTLKLFPVGSVVSLRRSASWALMLLMFMVLGGPRLVSELSMIAARTQYSSSSSFGVSILPWRISTALGHEMPLWTSRAYGLAGLVIVTVGTAAVLRAGRLPVVRAQLIDLADALSRDSGSRAMATVGGGSFLCAYLIGASWDYRLILLIPCVVAFAMHDRPRSAARVLTLLTLSAMFASYPLGRLDIIGDVLLLLLAPTLAITIALVAHQVGTRRSLAANPVP